LIFYSGESILLTMNKIWAKKTNSFKAAFKLDEDYYLRLSGKERLEVMQFLREIRHKIKGARYRKLQRVVKVIQ